MTITKELIARLDELGMNRLEEAAQTRLTYLRSLNVEAEIQKTEELLESIKNQSL